MKCRGCLTSLLVVIAIGIVTSSAVFLNLGRFLDASDSLTEADAIIVLGGEGARFMRTRHAIDLYTLGSAPKVVFSGGSLLTAGIACTSTALSADAAQELGLPSDAIVLAAEAQSTYDEAVNFRKLVAEQGWQSIIIVTDRFHTRRSVQTMRSLISDVDIQVSTPDDPLYMRGRWWSTERGLTFVMSEVLKLGFYWVEYGIGELDRVYITFGAGSTEFVQAS